VELFTDWHTWAEAEPEVRRLLPPATAGVVARAVLFASDWHGNQQRPTGVPYLEHLLETLEVLVCGEGTTDPDVLAAGVLHDVLEDTNCTTDEVSRYFGQGVAELVQWVTKPAGAAGGGTVTGDTVAGEAGTGYASSKEAYLDGLKRAPRKAKLVKLADRASNVQTLRNMPGLDWQRKYYAQTVRFIIPLAATEPWFAEWYASWERDFADLAEQPARTEPAD
jgi:guanosine-3',5'-bis(diphosphate) 3'-pyrophosphohydrolase